MKLRTACVLLVALALAVSCRKGPGKEELKGQVQAGLDGSFHAGLFQVEKLVRKGSHPYEEDGDDRARLLIYYDAEIVFLEDYKLSDWDQLNVGSLISVLGAKPLGVRGVNPEGNAKGETLSVYGTAAFVKEGDGWARAAHVPSGVGAEAPEARPEKVPHQLYIEEVEEIAQEFKGAGGGADMAYLEDGLAELRAGARRRLGKSRNWVTIATGNRSGEYYALGKALEKTLKKGKNRARAYDTSGSMENVVLADAGEVLFAFAQNDIAYMAHNGTGLFQDRVPLGNLTALCSLYPEAVQIVTLKSANLTSIRDLGGKRIDIGLADSGVRVNALQVLKAAGLKPEQFAAVEGRPIGAALDDLAAGGVDAVFVTAAYPAEAVQRLAFDTPIHLISLDDALFEEVKRRYPFLVPVSLPRNTYPGMAEDCRTVAVTATIVTHKDTPNHRVKAFLDHLFANVDALSRGSLQAYYISKATAATGINIPLHRAAKQYFASESN